MHQFICSAANIMRLSKNTAGSIILLQMPLFAIGADLGRAMGRSECYFLLIAKGENPWQVGMTSR